MKSATGEFMSYLRSLDIKLWADEGRLRYSAPKGAMTAVLRGQLKARKTELLSFMQQASTFQESSGVIRRVSRTDDLPLSFAQQRLWFMHYFEGGQSVAYNVPASHSFFWSINLDRLRQSLAHMIERHETLRTTFPMRNGSPVQQIAEKVKIELPLINLIGQSEEEQHEAMNEWAGKLLNRPFDLENGPLLRVRLLQFGEEEYLLLAAMHHIISDAWSMEIFIREWTTLYEYLEELEEQQILILHKRQRNGYNNLTRQVPRPPLYPLSKLDIQYADFASWQRQHLTGEVLKEQVDYWTTQLRDAPPLLELPTDYARPPVQTGSGSTIFFEMSAELTQKLNVLSKQSQTTLFMTVMTAFVAIFSRYSGQEDVVVGTLIANRNRSEVESLIGFFINTLVLRISLVDNPTLQELLQHVREVTLGAYAHQDMPFEELVRLLEPERNLSYNPLFQVMFVWQNVPTQQVRSVNLLPEAMMGGSKRKESLIATGFEEESGTAMFDLFITMWEEDQQIKGSLTYNSDLFELDTMARMGGHVGKALETMVRDAQERVMGFSLLSEAERHQLLVEWNAPRGHNQPLIEHSKDKCFHEQFEEQVRRTPNDVAVEFEDEPFTYYELNRSANKLAHWLIEQGIGPDTIVALLAYRSIDFLISMLAIFKAGGAYLPIDPLQPPARISQIFRQSEVPLVLSTLQLAPLLVETLEACQADSWPQLLFIEDALTWPTAIDTSKNPPLRNRSHDLAYVIYTSGSTGIPKGAMVEHKGMLNHLYAKIYDLKLTNLDIIAQNAPQSFDISVWQFLAALLVGGQVNIFNDHAARDPNILLKQVAKQGITILEVVPSLLAMMLEVMPNVNPDLSDLRWLIPTGEALPPQLCRQWLEQFPHVPVINAYGPTECSDDVTHYPIYEAPAEEVFNIPIGRPIINTNLYILDRLLQPVPIGVAGELHVGGVGVGRGYLNDPERTQKAFVANPFAHAKAQSSQDAKKKKKEKEKEKKKTEFLLETSFAASPDVQISKENDYLYKTGDKARYLPDGNIEFLGRLDHQVKIRGFRIELGEIEAALMQLPVVYQTAVVARTDGRKSKRLVAYVVPNQEPAPTVSELRRVLKEKLPDYMVPAHFVTLDALPLTHNGKVNRRDLEKRPLIGAALDDEFVPPRNPAELELVRIWQELLEVNPIGVRDNFFDLGGHSLLAVRLMSRIETRFGGNLPLTTLFQSPTIEELALVVSQEQQPVSVSAFSCLVPIQPMGQRTPFFAIHALGGGVFSYMPLSRRLGFEQPFYGMQAVGLNGEGEPLNRIDAMAAHYIEAMQSVQPEGPYQLGGWSSGGIIAFEMAQQLRNAGHEVALLALIDSYALNEPAPKQKEMDIFTKMVEDITNLVEDTAQGMRKRVQQQPAEEDIQELLQKANGLNLLPPETSRQQMPHLLKVFTANNQAAADYTTQPYPGRITLLYANQVTINDPTRGWSHLAQGGLELYSIASGHFEMLEEPVVELIAKRLNAALAS